MDLSTEVFVCPYGYDGGNGESSYFIQIGEGMDRKSRFWFNF